MACLTAKKSAKQGNCISGRQPIKKNVPNMCWALLRERNAKQASLISVVLDESTTCQAVSVFWGKEQHTEKACAFPWWSQREMSSAHALKITDNPVRGRGARCSWPRGLLPWSKQRGFPFSIDDSCTESCCWHSVFYGAVASRRQVILGEGTTKCWSTGTTCRPCWRRSSYRTYYLPCIKFWPCYNVFFFYSAKTN